MPVGPRFPVQSSLDVSGFLRAGGQVPIPIDTILIEIRHQSDSTVAFSQQLPVSRFQQQQGDYRINIALTLRSSTEDFYLYAEARGGGVVYFTVQQTVTATAGQSVATQPITPTYVGPGSTADSVQLSIVPNSVTTGDSALATAVVFDGDTVVPGVPVGIIPSDSTVVRATAVGVDQAWLVSPATGSGTMTIQALTPTSLSTTGSFSWSTGAAVTSVFISPTTPSIPVAGSIDLGTTVYDANDNILTGLPESWVSRTPAVATVAPSTGVVTGVSLGTSMIVVTVGGVSDSTLVTVAPPGGPANLTSNSATTLSAQVNQLVTAPSVLVTDAGLQPVSGVTVQFTVNAGGGTLTGASPATNASGIATVTSWRLGTLARVDTVTATVAGLADTVRFVATATPTGTVTLVKISGDAQSDSTGRTLALPLVAEAQDSFGNAVSGATMTWTPTDGTVAPTSGTTNSLGRDSTVWTLGSTQPSPTVTAAVGVHTVVFSATTLFGQPQILLSQAGIPGVGVGLSATIDVNLTSPAPAGGLAVNLSSTATGTFTVAPGTLNIPSGQTSGTATVTGVSSGTATLNATATGYLAGALSIDVQNRNVSVPLTLNVPYGQTSSLPITLPAPAPAGGVTFTVVSSDPTRVAVLTPTVTIAAGGSTGNATLSGVLPGPAIVTVDNPAFVAATSNATTTASLDITVTSLTVNASFASPITINFESNSLPAAAPAPGITVTLVPANPACVAAVSPVTIGTGLVTTTSSLSYGGSATLPCTTQVLATAPNLQPDSLTVTVNPVPPITVNTNSAQIGAGLYEAGSVSLGATNHGGVTVTVTSSDTTLLVVTNVQTNVGAPSVAVPVLPLVGSFTYYAMAKEGVTGTVVVTATAPGFAPVPDTLTIVPPGIELQGLPASTQTLSSNNNLYAQVGLPNGQLTGLSRVENFRPGGPLVVATFSIGGTGGGLVLDSLTTPTGATSGTARFSPNLYYTSTSGPTVGGIAYHPVGGGNDTVNVTAPGFISLANATRAVVVAQPNATISINSIQIGVGLQEAGGAFLSASQHGGATVTLTSRDPSVVLLDTLSNGPGHPSITKTLTNGQASFTYYAQILESAQFSPAYVVISEPRFTSDSVQITAVQPGVELIGLPTTTTTLSGNNNLYAQVGLPNGQLTGLSRVQNLRGGAPAPVPVTFASQPTGIGTLFDTLTQSTGGADTATALVDTTLVYYTPTNGPNGRGIAYHPLSAGRDTVTVFAPGYATMSVNGFRTIDITQPTSNISVNSTSIGSGLQEAGSASLSASQHGGATVTLTSTNPAAILIDTLPGGVGHPSITKTLLNGQASFTWYAQALEGQTDSAYVRVSEPRFVSDSTIVRAVVPGIELVSVPTTTTPLTADQNFYAQIGLMNGQNTGLSRVQNRRGGAPGVLTATVNSSSAAIGTIVDSLSGPNGNASGTARVAPNIYYTPTSGPSVGGWAFHPLLLGQTTVSVSMPGFTTATTNGNRLVNVNQPGITVGLNSTLIGSGLQEGGSGNLGAAQHGGVTLTLTSSDSTVLKLAPNATTAGAASIQIVIPNGQTGYSFVAQGMEGIVAPTTVTITAVASGFTNGTTSGTVEQGGVEVISLNGPYTAGGADVNFYAQVGIPNAQNSALSRVQNLRFGAPASLTVSFSSSNAAAGTLVDSVGPGTPKTAQVAVGTYYTPTSGVPQGGIAFRPLTPGQTTVTASITGFLTMAVNGIRLVTVQ